MLVCVSGGKKYLFFELFGLLYFLVTEVTRKQRFEIRLFALIPTSFVNAKSRQKLKYLKNEKSF